MKKTGILYQTALFQSVALGEYHGFVTVGRLKEHGDFGMGIFEDVNGELIMTDGVVYQALADGSVVVPGDDVRIPYADVTFFKADLTLDDVRFENFGALEEILDKAVFEAGMNQFYYAKITGLFRKASVRSELRQKEPFRMLNIALRTDQRRYDHENVDGTIVGLYCPPFMGMLNAPGWHFHFISDDAKIGGHMLEAACDTAHVELDKMSSFALDVPDTASFNGLDLGVDLSAAIREAEKPNITVGPERA